MKRLIDGAFAAKTARAGPFLVRSVINPTLRLTLDEDPCSSEHASAGPVTETDAPDPVLTASYAAFGEGLEVSTWDEAERALLPALRAQAAAHERFTSMLDTVLVPESALAMARRLRRLAGPRVLVTGGFALAGHALSALGAEVTCLEDGEGSLLEAPLEASLRRAFDLVLVDTLPYPGREVGALCRALGALGDGGLLGAFGHCMHRPAARERFAAASLEVTERLFEIAQRVHADLALGAAAWDVWLLRQAGAPPLDEGALLDDARGLEPKESRYGCVDVRGFAEGGLSAEGMDEAVARIEGAGFLDVVHEMRADGGGLLRRHLVLARGGTLTMSARPDAGEVLLDLSPWSPASLSLAAVALRLACGIAPAGGARP